MRNLAFQALAEAARIGEPVALGIISGTKGSSPQKLGAKAVFHADGRIDGTLGGGCLEAEVQRRALQALQTGKPAEFELVLDHDFGWDDGLMCGGKVCGLILPNAQTPGSEFWSALADARVTSAWGVSRDFSIQAIEVHSTLHAGDEWCYQETVTPACVLWIAGAGHIAQAVAPLALRLGFDVTVFDDRPALVNHRYFPEQTGLQSDLWETMLALPLPGPPAFGLIVTRGHRHDALVLRSWIQRPFAFLGMIGSARKWRMIREHFEQEKIATAEQLQRVACPVGIEIRSETVEEIAVSIAAQLIEKRAELRVPRQQ
jgi:xanthine dehydrogenase accessory factor